MQKNIKHNPPHPNFGPLKKLGPLFTMKICVNPRSILCLYHRPIICQRLPNPLPHLSRVTYFEGLRFYIISPRKLVINLIIWSVRIGLFFLIKPERPLESSKTPPLWFPISA